MNVKLAEQAVRFKISEDELNALLQGQDVVEQIKFTGKDMRILICPVADDEGCGVCPELISMDDMVFVNLIIGHERLQKLYDMGRSREGIICQCGDIDVALQVDYRKDSRKAGMRA